MASSAVIDSIKLGRLDKSFPESAYDYNLKSAYDKVLEHLGPTVATDTDVKFDPFKHLRYYADQAEKEKFAATKRLTMEELGLSNPKQVSQIGVSDPFPIFTDEAVHIMRREVLRKETFLKYARYCYNSTSGLDANLRGYVKNDDDVICPFIYEAWTNPKTMELVSMMAGVDLEVIMDYEIAHINISMKSESQAEEERVEMAKQTTPRAPEDIPAIVGWHHDSYPFVCVLMLSDTTNMIGGETSLKKGKKGDEPQEIAVVPGPKQGYGSVLQGRFVEHIAPVPLGSSERITMVTSYRAKNTSTFDDSVCGTVKPEVNYGSRYCDFYPEWIGYRSEIIKGRLDSLNQKLKSERKAGKFDKEAAMEDLKYISGYLVRTFEEMEITDAEWERIISKN